MTNKKISELDLIALLSETDEGEVISGGVNYRYNYGQVSDLLASLIQWKPISIDYADITDMLADQASQVDGMWYRVADGSDDPDVDSGWVIYEYLGTTTASLSDYFFVLDQESLNVTIQDATDTVKGIMKLYTTTGVNTDGTITQAAITTVLGLKLDATLAALSTLAETAAADTPLDADTYYFYDFVDAVLKKVSWVNIKATLKTYFDSIYTTTSAVATQIATALTGYQALSGKDATGGYVGLTLFKINFKNVANTLTSFFTNSNTAARTYTFQDRDGTIADDTDLALKAPLNSPAFTGTPTAPTPAFGDDSTRIATTAFVKAQNLINVNLFVARNPMFDYQNYG